MKTKLVLISIIILSLLCVPCLMSLAESTGDTSSQSSSASIVSSSSAEAESESSEGENDSDSDSENGSDSESSSTGSDDSSSSSEDEEDSSSSSEGHRFSGDPVQGKTPKFSDLDLGDCDPDDGKDFKIKPEDIEGYSVVVLNNTNIKKMKGNDNFYIDFEDCRFWLPIEIPAGCVVDDNLLSNLTVSYGAVSDSVINKVVSSIKSSQILQTFSLSMINYDVKGQPHKMNSFDGTVKITYAVNAACINQYNHDQKLALVHYDTNTHSLKPLEYTLDTESRELTVYASCSGDFFILNSAELDLSTEIKLNSNAPFLKVFLYLVTFLSLVVSVGFAGLIIYKDYVSKRRKKKPEQK